MALINCPECSREISEKAPQCPQCGYQQRSTTIEGTGKRWKALQALGVVGLFVGFPLSLVVTQGESAFRAVPLLTFGVFSFLLLYGSVRAWWENA